MIKRAPLVFAAAAVLLLGTMGLSKRVDPGDDRLPLDFSGIDTLVLIEDEKGAGPEPQILIDSTQPGSATHAHQKEPLLTVERQGTTLRLTSKKPAGWRYYSFKLVVPASLRTISVSRASIVAGTRIDALEIEVGRDVTWSGAARSLVLRERREQRECECKCRCSATLRVATGAIEELRVETESGNVDIQQPQSVHIATLALGPEASLSVGHVGSMDKLQIVPFAP